MTLFRSTLCATLIALPTGLFAGAHGAAVTVTMAGPDGAAMGEVTLTPTPHGVLVQADLTRLTPGAHGFHIHETGACTPDFGAAGGHYNPDDSGHGIMVETGMHAGDLPNIHAAADGTARADFLTDAVALDDGSLLDADGAAIVVHENPDSYGEDAGAGGRVACGVIGAAG